MFIIFLIFVKTFSYLIIKELNICLSLKSIIIIIIKILLLRVIVLTKTVVLNRFKVRYLQAIKLANLYKI